jgi:hypothetical protein
MTGKPWRFPGDYGSLRIADDNINMPRQKELVVLSDLPGNNQIRSFLHHPGFGNGSHPGGNDFQGDRLRNRFSAWAVAQPADIQAIAKTRSARLRLPLIAFAPFISGP